MAPLCGIFALLFLPLVSGAVAPFIGGGANIKFLAAQLLSGYYKLPKAVVAPYDVVGSDAGIAGFIAKKYAAAVADYAMTKEQETELKVYKITLPLVITTVNFFTKSTAAVTLTPIQTLRIYAGKITAWSQITTAAGIISGPIVPIARRDIFSSTRLVQQFWLASGTLYSGPLTGTAFSNIFDNSNIVDVLGNDNMCGNISVTAGGIGYAGTGVCKAQIVKKLITEVKLINKKGKPVDSKTWSAASTFLKLKPPSPLVSWAGRTYVWGDNAKSPPMAALEFVFIRQSSKGVPNAAAAKAFLIYAGTKINSLAAVFGFTAVPVNFFGPSMAFVRKVVV